MSDSLSSASSIGGGPRRLTATVHTQADFVVNRDTGYRVQVAVAAENMDAHVFRYLYEPPTGPNPPAVRYDGVCSPTDLAQFPAGDPRPDAFPAWCRRDSVDLVFRSTAEAADMILVLREELQTLVDSLNRMDALRPGAVFVIQ